MVGETEDERPSLAEVSAEAIAALREQTRSYAKRLKGGCKACGRTEDDDGGERLRGNQRAAAGAMAKLLDSARKIQEDGLAVVSLMSFPERAELFVTWYTELPPVYRSRLRDQMSEWETRLALPGEVG